MRPQPVDERQDVDVSPHPDREATELAECLHCRAPFPTAHEAVHAIGIGPVGLHCDRVEAALLDEEAGNPGSLAVELVRPVGSLPEEHHARIADPIQERRVVISAPNQLAGRRAH
jgi:hypothetical protein